MLCPVCRQPLLIVEFQDIELDACPDCGGVWFDAQELQQLFQLLGAPEQLYELEHQLKQWPNAGARRCCPRCNARIEPVRVPSTEGELILDQCRRGHGLWFDRGELEALLRLLLGEASNALSQVREYLGQFAAARNADPPAS